MVFKSGDDFYVLGGVQPGASGLTALQDLWRLRISTDSMTWTQLSTNFPVALWNANAVTLGNDVFVYGGYALVNGVTTQQSALYRNSIETVAQNTWTTIDPTGAPNQVLGKSAYKKVSSILSFVKLIIFFRRWTCSHCPQ